MEICGPIGNSQGCSVCERCKAETLLAEAKFRECGLRERLDKLTEWLGAIESFPIGVVPGLIAAETMQNMARSALAEASKKAENSNQQEPRQ